MGAPPRAGCWGPLVWALNSRASPAGAALRRRSLKTTAKRRWQQQPSAMLRIWETRTSSCREPCIFERVRARPPRGEAAPVPAGSPAQPWAPRHRSFPLAPRPATALAAGSRPSWHDSPVGVVPTVSGGKIPSRGSNQHGKALPRPARAGPRRPGVRFRTYFLLREVLYPAEPLVTARATERSRVGFTAVEAVPLVFPGRRRLEGHRL